LNLELFIAKRLVKGQNNKKGISRPIVAIAIAGIALGLTVMILSVAIVTGFQNEISNKVAGFGSHIHIINLDSNISYETTPIRRDQDFLPRLQNIDEIRHIQAFATKPGIIRTGDEIQGVILKGIDGDFKWDFFEQNMVEGSAFSVSDTVTKNSVVISQSIASLLRLDVGDDFGMYFVQDPPRARRFTVEGIYETGLEELDKHFVLADIKHIQRLNEWDENQVSGFEIILEDFEKLERVSHQVFEEVGYTFTQDRAQLRVTNIRERYPHIFDWLQLLDMNVWVILTLMVVVAGFNMVSGLLILILEHTGMIGVLKSLGITNISLRKVFLYQSAYLVGKGLLWGNILGLVLALIQHWFGIVKLDEASYFVETVPVNLNIIHLLLLNAGTMIVTISMLIIPSYIIGRISPQKTIRFD